MLKPETVAEAIGLYRRAIDQVRDVFPKTEDEDENAPEVIHAMNTLHTRLEKLMRLCLGRKPTGDEMAMVECCEFDDDFEENTL